MSHKTKKVYRLALYGLPGSGKTCLLAALAMPRLPHPLGHSCIWRFFGTPKVDMLNEDEVAVEELNEQDKQLIIRQHSQQWMKTAIHKLSEHEVPPPNPTFDDPFVFEYDFTASTHQTFRIELTDYSGQLIDPSLSESELATNLRHRFAEMDGVLILAEAPFHEGVNQIAQKNQNTQKGGGKKQVYADLYLLQQAFSLLSCERETCAALDIPVVLLINKWDRYSNIDYANPVSEQKKLEDFLNSSTPPPHKGLCDVLKFSVTEGNFKVLPVSALGASECVLLEQGDTVEQPIQVNPINAFGLEDAFIWLAQQRNAIDLKEFGERSLKCPVMAKGMGLELLNRFPKYSDETKKIQAILKVGKKVKNFRIFYMVIVVIAMWLITETSLDVINYKKHQIVADSPQATHEQLGEAENWLTQYIAAPYFRHLISKIFLNQEQAQNILIQLQAHREKFLWEPVEKALQVNLQVALVPATTYLKYYPYGKHVQEAQDIKLRAEFMQLKQINQEAFHKLAIQVQEHKQDVNKLNQLLKELRYLPLYPQAETEDMRQQRITLGNQVSGLLLQKDINQKMQAGKFLAAARLLNNQPEIHLSMDFKEDFKKEVLGKIEQQVTIALKINKELDIADKLLKEYTNDFPSSLQTEEGKAKVAALQLKVNERQDERLYEAAKKYKNLEHVQKYLQKAPLLTMAKEVSAYKAFLNSVDPSTTLHKLQLKLVQIHWEHVSDYDNTISVFLNGKRVIYNEQVNAKYHSSIELNETCPVFVAKPNDQITVTIKIVNDDWFFDDDYGHASVEMPVSELAKGYSLTLRSDKGVKTGVVFLEIIGYPKAPPLPRWQHFNFDG